MGERTFSSSASRKALALMLVFGLVLVGVPTASASQELIENGGFETGNFNGWTASDANVRPSTTSKSGTYYEPAHSGKYLARLGTELVEGSISQSVTIPAKSEGKFTAWYRVEKGSSLTVFIKRSDGSVIHEWAVTSVTSWTSVAYDLDLPYAGQSVSIEFVGVGHEETVTTTGYCYDPFTGQVYLCPSTESIDYWPYVDDVSLTSSIVAYETSVSVAGLPQELRAQLYVDGSQVAVISPGQFKILSFRIGESHQISVDTYVQKDDQTRYYCGSDSATVSSDGPVAFTYTPQFYLSVSSPYGTTSGSGWYDEGSTASFSVDRDAIQMTGLIGILGGKYAFDGWNDDATDGATRGEIVMNSPRSISALWRTDYSAVYVAIAIVLVFALGGFLGYKRIRKMKSKPDRTEVYDIEPVAIEGPQTGEETVARAYNQEAQTERDENSHG